MAIQNQVAIEVVLQLQRLRGDLRKLQSSFDSSFKQVQARADGVRRALRNAIVGAFAGISAKSIIDIGVEMDSLRRRLKVVSKDSEDFNRSLRYLQREADRLSQNFAALTNSYASFRAATDAAGLSVDEANRIFSAFNEAITALGLSTEESGRIFLALRQMVSGGVLQLQELNQIAESLPGAFNIFAQAIGTNVQGLRELTSEARINAAPALLRVAEILEQRFGRSVEESANSARAAFNRLSTAWQRFADAIAQSGVLDIVTDAVNKLTQALRDPRVIETVRNFTAGLVTGIRAAAEHLKDLIKLVVVLKTVISSVDVGAKLGSIGGAAGRAVGGLTGGLVGAGAAIVALKELETLLAAIGASYKRTADAASVYARQVAELRRDIEIANSAVIEYSKALAEAMKIGDQRRIAELRAELNRWAYILAESRKALNLLAKNGAGNVATAAKHDKATIATPAISDVLAAPKLKIKPIDVEAVKRDVAAIEAEILRLQGKTVEATKLALETQFADLRKKLQKLGDVGGLRKLDRLIDLTVARERLQQLRDEFNRVTADANESISLITQKATAGLISAAEARNKITAIYRDAIKAYNDLEKRASNIPGADRFISELRRAVEQTKIELESLQSTFSQFFMRVRDNIRSSMSDMLYSLASGAKNIKQALRDFGLSILESLQRRTAEQAANTIVDALFGQKTKSALDEFANSMRLVFNDAGKSLSSSIGSALKSVLGSVSSGFGGLFKSLFGSIGNLFSAGLFHDGKGATKRVLNGAFIAPKLHNGLMPDEFLAVLQKGEMVLPKNAVSSINKQTAKGQQIVVNNSFIIQNPADRNSQEQIAAKAGLAISRAVRRIA